MSIAAGSLFDIDGRVALITGASSGIGRMIARVLTANGAHTYITGRDSVRLAEAVEELRQLGECTGLEASLSDMDGIERLAAEMRKRESDLDILINNAGAWSVGPIEHLPESEWNQVFELNVKAPFFLIQQLLPELLASADRNNSARVINISSIRARMADAPSIPYNSSKAALEHLTRVLAKQLAQRHVTVNAIAPGWFPTRMNESFINARSADMLARIPQGRFGSAEDIGGLALFLCSPAAAYLTGQVISLDGGMMLGL